MLHQAANRLPQGVKVILLADRGFIHTEAMTAITTQLGWHYRIRVKRNTWIWRAGRGWCQLKDIHLQRGEACCWHTVKLHKGQWYGPVHVAFGCNNVNSEFWAIVSDEPTSLHTFEEYGLRFDIEILQPQYPHSRLQADAAVWASKGCALPWFSPVKRLCSLSSSRLFRRTSNAWRFPLPALPEDVSVWILAVGA